MAKALGTNSRTGVHIFRVHIKPCSHGAMYNPGTSRDWIQRTLPCYTSQNWGISRSGSVRGPALINNVENNFRCLETCTHVQLHTHGNTYTHICTPYSYTYRNIKWIKLLSRFFFFSGFTNESVAYAISLLWVLLLFLAKWNKVHFQVCFLLLSHHSSL